MRDFFDRLLGGRKPDAHRRAIGQRLQPLQRERQVRAALVVGDGVDFVHDDGLDIAQNRAALFRGQQDVERLGRGDQNVRRPLQHRPPLVHQRVAGADGGANLRHQQSALARHLQNLAERDFEILLDVVAQRLQRRDVENFSAVVQIAGQRLAHQAINAGKKCSQRFAGAGGRGDQRGASGEDMRPALLLRLGRRAELRGQTTPRRGDAPRRERREGTSADILPRDFRKTFAHTTGHVGPDALVRAGERRSPVGCASVLTQDPPELRSAGQVRTPALRRLGS